MTFFLQALQIEDKFNSLPQSKELSEEDLHALDFLQDGLLKIAKFLNISVVDEKDLSSIIDVGLKFLSKGKLIEADILELKNSIVNGQISPLPWSLDDLPISINTNGIFCERFFK